MYLSGAYDRTAGIHLMGCCTVWLSEGPVKINKLENVAIAMHCNLRPPDVAQSLSALISSPVPSLKSLSLSIVVLERFYCLCVTLRCDLEL